MLVNDKIFNNIKIHTQYSICEGAIKIDELAEYCKLNKNGAASEIRTRTICLEGRYTSHYTNAAILEKTFYTIFLRRNYFMWHEN